MNNYRKIYDRIILQLTRISIRFLPKKLKSFIKKIYTPYNLFPCRFGESLIKPERLQFLLFLLQNQIYKKTNGDVIEIGVFRGGSIKRMGLKLKELHSDKKVYGVDTFEGHPYSSEEDLTKDGKAPHYKGRYRDVDFDKVKKVILEEGANNVILFKGEVDNIPTLKDKKFCFAHIDVDTYLSSKQCIEFLKDRMVESGLILFDDYNGTGTIGETKAVDELLGKENIIEIGELGCYWTKSEEVSGNSSHK